MATTRVTLATATPVPPNYNDDRDAAAPPPLATAVLAAAPAGSNRRELYHHPYLQSLGYPEGIKRCLVDAMDDFALRYWIVDNSGSMACTDGHRLVGAAGKQRMIPCSRWLELGDSLRWHAKLADALGAPTEFHLLNEPGSRRATRVVSVATPESLERDENPVQMMEQVCSSQPNGGTPLCAKIHDAVARVRQLAPQLRSERRRVNIVIASDGAASDGDVAAALRPLQGLPCNVVIRLCTDDDSIVKYWNQVDEDLELNLDVLDDIAGEASEVNEHAPWLTYGTPLHMLREWGTSERLFDFIDERELSLPELREFVGLIFGAAALERLPQPECEGWESFERGVAQLQSESVWCPAKGKPQPWIDVRRMRRHFRPLVEAGNHVCTIC